MQAETADIAAVTCGLLDNMVTVCGEVWRQCHDLAQVMVTRDTRHVTHDTCCRWRGCGACSWSPWWPGTGAPPWTSSSARASASSGAPL